MDWEKRREKTERIAEDLKDIPMSDEALLVAKGFQVAAEVLRAHDAAKAEKQGKGESA